ncbi:hypothetical protein [Marivita sp.]|uniref:hypothetical protein n=1 Tax=Marivita sp. TaxID=2003365 RepID=UPI0025BD01C7|nr:hypothetical protein [Marivita sp.]
MVVKFLKGILKLGFYAAGLAAIVGIWDYTRQAKMANYDYSTAQYSVSVLDRYGAEAEFVLSRLEVARNGLQTGAEWAGASDMLDTLPLPSAVPSGVAAEANQGETGSEGTIEPVAGAEGVVHVNATAEVELALAESALAPETSLFPRARAAR